MTWLWLLLPLVVLVAIVVTVARGLSTIEHSVEADADDQDEPPGGAA